MTEFDIAFMMVASCLVGIVLTIIFILRFTCNHKYDTIDTLSKNHPITGRSIVYVQQCKECGKIKKKEVK